MFRVLELQNRYLCLDEIGIFDKSYHKQDREETFKKLLVCKYFLNHITMNYWTHNTDVNISAHVPNGQLPQFSDPFQSDELIDTCPCHFYCFQSHLWLIQLKRAHTLDRNPIHRQDRKRIKQSFKVRQISASFKKYDLRTFIWKKSFFHRSILFLYISSVCWFCTNLSHIAPVTWNTHTHTYIFFM